MTCVTHFDTGMSEIHSMQAFYQNDSALCHQKEKVWDCAHSSWTQTVHTDYVVVS